MPKSDDEESSAGYDSMALNYPPWPLSALADSQERYLALESPEVLYEQDFPLWAMYQGANLRALSEHGNAFDSVLARRAGLDLKHLAEEIEDLAKRDEQALKSQLERIAAHLIKLRYQPTENQKSWRLTIIEARNRVEDLLESRSLQVRITEAELDKIFQRARRWALEETGLPSSAIPSGVLFSLAQLRDHDFFPVG